MNRALRVARVIALFGLLIFAIWAGIRHSSNPSGSATVAGAIRSAATNPVQFAKDHFTGGIGALLQPDPATGAVVIREVLHGSPAEKAGLREDDLILEIDGVPTKGRTLDANVESISGFVAGSTTLTIQRKGSTNLQCVLRRSSWNSLGFTNFGTPPANITSLSNNVGVTNFGTPTGKTNNR
jgi:membrane-associated protease RseP (regulator of RpoE activity)